MVCVVVGAVLPTQMTKFSCFPPLITADGQSILSILPPALSNNLNLSLFHFLRQCARRGAVTDQAIKQLQFADTRR